MCCPMGSPRVDSGVGRAKRYLEQHFSVEHRWKWMDTLHRSVGGYALDLLEREVLPLRRVCEDGLALWSIVE